MADFPKLEWVTINGKNEPFVYPQHEKENGDFVTTGENNPLPTGDYGMTEGGVWIPKRVDDEGHTLTQVTGSIVELEDTDTSQTITAGSSITILENEKRTLFSKIRGMVRMDSPSNVEIELRGVGSTTGYVIGRIVEHFESEAQLYFGFDVATSYYEINIINKEQNDISTRRHNIIGVI